MHLRGERSASLFAPGIDRRDGACRNRSSGHPPPHRPAQRRLRNTAAAATSTTHPGSRRHLEPPHPRLEQNRAVTSPASQLLIDKPRADDPPPPTSGTRATVRTGLPAASASPPPCRWTTAYMPPEQPRRHGRLRRIPHDNDHVPARASARAPRPAPEPPPRGGASCHQHHHATTCPEPAPACLQPPETPAPVMQTPPTGRNTDPVSRRLADGLNYAGHCGQALFVTLLDPSSIGEADAARQRPR